MLRKIGKHSLHLAPCILQPAPCTIQNTNNIKINTDNNKCLHQYTTSLKPNDYYLH